MSVCLLQAVQQSVRTYVGGQKNWVEQHTLKICGHAFRSKPNIAEQVQVIERKFNEPCWALRNLKRARFKKDDLLTSYTSLIRPVFDFTSIVYPSLLTGEQKQTMERLKKRALQIIVNEYDSYLTFFEKMDITTLECRRLDLADRFLNKVIMRGIFAER